MDTQAERWEALRAEFAALRADLAEVAADVAAIGVERTYAALLAARYVAKWGVRMPVATVAPVAPVVPVTGTDIPRPSVQPRTVARFHRAARIAFAPFVVPVAA
jgi:hypothetical protein